VMMRRRDQLDISQTSMREYMELYISMWEMKRDMLNIS
jgi:hypothetical protein